MRDTTPAGSGGYHITWGGVTASKGNLGMIYYETTKLRAPNNEPLGRSETQSSGQRELSCLPVSSWPLPKVAISTTMKPQLGQALSIRHQNESLVMSIISLVQWFPRVSISSHTASQHEFPLLGCSRLPPWTPPPAAPAPRERCHGAPLVVLQPPQVSEEVCC